MDFMLQTKTNPDGVEEIKEIDANQDISVPMPEDRVSKIEKNRRKRRNRRNSPFASFS